MAEQLNLSINIDGNANESLGTLKKQLKEAQKEVENLASKFGTTSEEAINAAKKAAELKDQIGEAKDLINTFNPDTKFSALSKTLNTVVGSFTAVQGALGLLGAEGEEVEKTIAKVQSALALSQGLEQIGELGDAFTNLKTVALDAFKGIKAAIGSTGIGLLLIALGAVVAYWDDIKGAISGVSEEQKKLNKASEANLKVQKDKLDAIESQENTLKLQGKTEKEILALKIAQTNQVITASIKTLKNLKDTRDGQIAAAERNKNILQGIIKFISLPLTSILNAIDLAGSAVGKNFGLVEKFAGSGAKLIFDPDETKDNIDKSIADLEKGLIDTQNKKDGYILAGQAIDKAAASESNKVRQESRDKIIKDQEEDEKLKKEKDERESAAFKVSLDSYRATLSERERETLNAEDALEKKKEVLIRAGNTNFEQLDAEHKIIRDAINKKYDDKENEDLRIKNEKKLASEQALIDQKLQLQTLSAETDAEKRAAEIAIIEEEYRKKIELATKNGEDTVTLEAIKEAKITAIKNVGIENDKKIAKEKQQADINGAMQTLDIIGGMVDKNSIAGKGIAIAQAIMNTYQGASKAIAQGGTFGPALAAVTIAAGLMNVKKIISTKIPSAKGSGSVGGGGGGGAMSGGSSAAPIQPQMPQAQLTQLNQSSINAIGNQSMRAYVVETDVTSSQQRIAAIQQRARFE